MSLKLKVVFRAAVVSLPCIASCWLNSARGSTQEDRCREYLYYASVGHQAPRVSTPSDKQQFLLALQVAAGSLRLLAEEQDRQLGTPSGSQSEPLPSLFAFLPAATRPLKIPSDPVPTEEILSARVESRRYRMAVAKIDALRAKLKGKAPDKLSHPSSSLLRVYEGEPSIEAYLQQATELLAKRKQQTFLNFVEDSMAAFGVGSVVSGALILALGCEPSTALGLWGALTSAATIVIPRLPSYRQGSLESIKADLTDSPDQVPLFQIYQGRKSFYTHHGRRFSQGCAPFHAFYAYAQADGMEAHQILLNYTDGQPRLFVFQDAQ